MELSDIIKSFFKRPATWFKLIIKLLPTGKKLLFWQKVPAIWFKLPIKGNVPDVVCKSKVCY